MIITKILKPQWNEKTCGTVKNTNIYVIRVSGKKIYRKKAVELKMYLKKKITEKLQVWQKTKN